VTAPEPPDAEPIRAAIYRLAEGKLGMPPPWTGDTRLLGAGALDSISFVGLLADLEEEFHIELDFFDTDFRELMYVDGLVQRISGAIARARRG
jgi:acyl carrier protein